MATKTGYLMAAGLAVFLLVACNNQASDQAGQSGSAVNTPASAEQAAAPEANVQFPLTGQVMETFDSGGYTYLRMESGGQEYWVATMASQVKQGDEITVSGGQMMYNFHSRTLDRTFPEIIFASGLGGDQAASAQGATTEGAPGSFSDALSKEGQQGSSFSGETAEMTGSTKAVVPSADVQVEKAAGENAYTVGEVFAQADQLNGKEVKIRGKVMKVSQNIMGRNWVHLQDGTGDAQQSTHDLVVTTDAAPEQGSVVTVQGKVAAKKDFGAGYKYDAIVEDAKIAP